MSIRNLQYLFEAGSVALVGAGKEPGSLGAVLARNLFNGGFDGPVLPVNPRHAAIEGVLAYPDAAALPVAPDLAVIATPPSTVPGLIGAFAERGTKATVVITAGLGTHDAGGPALRTPARSPGWTRPTMRPFAAPGCFVWWSRASCSMRWKHSARHAG